MLQVLNSDINLGISIFHLCEQNVKNREDVAHTPVNENTRNVNVINGEAKEVKVKSWSTTSKYQDQPHEEYYADPVDITEMDYSPARRKPPIHN